MEGEDRIILRDGLRTSVMAISILGGLERMHRIFVTCLHLDLEIILSAVDGD